jgi:hypothetical protein
MQEDTGSAKQWSPWYVERCIRSGATPQSIAQEYDRNPEGTESLYFAPDKLAELRRKTIQRPTARGHLYYDPETLTPRFELDSSGELLFWLPSDRQGHPSVSNEYVVGCDVSHGLGGSSASNSATVALDRRTGEQMAEFVTRHMTPAKFALWNVALCKYLNHAQLNFEANGPTGRAFGNALQG